jgi:hypothetical protein
MMQFQANHTDFKNGSGYYKEMFMLNDKSLYLHEDNEAIMMYYEHPCWLLAKGVTLFPMKELQDGTVPRWLQSCGNTSATAAACNDNAISPDLAQSYCGPWLPSNLTKYQDLFQEQVHVSGESSGEVPTQAPTLAYNLSSNSSNSSNVSNLSEGGGEGGDGAGESGGGGGGGYFKTVIRWYSFAVIKANWS